MSFKMLLYKHPKPNKPRVVTSTRHSITIGWGTADTLSSSQSAASLRVTQRPSRTSLGSSDSGRSPRELSASQRPSKASIGSVEDLVEISKDCFVLQRKDRVQGWYTVYRGYRTRTEVGPLAPGDCYQFRLKIVSDEGEGPWSDVLTATTQDDQVPVLQLHRAIENGHLPNTRKVLNARPQAIDLPGRLGQLPLGLAAAKNDTNIVGLLLASGADVNGVDFGARRTPLMTASYQGHMELLEMLKEKGACWNLKDRSGCTAFHYAVDNSQIEVVKAALEEGVNIEEKDCSGWTPLMRGVTLKASLDMIDYLLEIGCDVNACDKRRQTVLMQSVLSGRPDVVRLLVRRGADINVKNIYGHTAFDMARASSNKEMLAVLPLLGQEVEPEIIYLTSASKKKTQWRKAASPVLFRRSPS